MRLPARRIPQLAGAPGEGDLQSVSLAESLAAVLPYPEPCLLLFPSSVFAFFRLQMKLMESLLGRTLPRCNGHSADVEPSNLCCLSVQ